MDWIRRPGGEARRRLSIGEGLYLADGADDLEAHGAGLELGPLGLLVPLRVTPLRVDLLLPAGHPSAAATLSVAGGLLLSLRRSDSDRRPPWPVEGESGFFLALPPRTFACRNTRWPDRGCHAAILLRAVWATGLISLFKPRIRADRPKMACDSLARARSFRCQAAA